MDDVEVVATASARPFTDSATDLRDLREARTALRKGKLRPGDAQFDLVYARALATPKWYYSTKHLKEWRNVVEALMGESVKLPPLFAGVLRSLISLLLSKPETTERALGLLTSLAKASGHISMNLVPMYRRLAERFKFKVSVTPGAEAMADQARVPNNTMTVGYGDDHVIRVRLTAGQNGGAGASDPWEGIAYTYDQVKKMSRPEFERRRAYHSIYERYEPHKINEQTMSHPISTLQRDVVRKMPYAMADRRSRPGQIRAGLDTHDPMMGDTVTADQIYEATGQDEQAASDAWHEFHGRQDDLLKTFGRRRIAEARATWAARQEIMQQPSTVADRRTQALLDGVGAAMGYDFTSYVGRASRAPTEGEIYAQAAAEDMRRRAGKPPLWVERNQGGQGMPEAAEQRGAGPLGEVTPFEMGLREQIRRPLRARHVPVERQDGEDTFEMTQRDAPNKRIQRRRYRRIRRDDELIDALLADEQNTDPVLREQLEQMKRERDQAAFYEAEQKRQAPASALAPPLPLCFQCLAAGVFLIYEYRTGLFTILPWLKL